jgi:hypothetical protein
MNIKHDYHYLSSWLFCSNYPAPNLHPTGAITCFERNCFFGLPGSAFYYIHSYTARFYNMKVGIHVSVRCFLPILTTQKLGRQI